MQTLKQFTTDFCIRIKLVLFHSVEPSETPHLIFSLTNSGLQLNQRRRSE